MNHPDWPAFLAAIVANPDDDTLRLVAADFLEENGDPNRAAFIRLQIALAQLEASGLGQTPEAGALRKKEQWYFGPLSGSRLWAAEDCPEFVHGTRTQTGPLDLRAQGADRLTWRRGFVEWVTCQTAEWLRHGASIRKRNPVRRVILSECASVARDTWSAGLDALRGLSQVDLKYAGYATGTPVEQGAELCGWLRERLPGTRVNMEITPF
jgi:uncharacterized protein (TIGR02996 family)